MDLETSEADMISRQGEQTDFHSSIRAFTACLACAGALGQRWKSNNEQSPCTLMLRLAGETDDKGIMTKKLQM